jgi:hypothetical protein
MKVVVSIRGLERPLIAAIFVVGLYGSVLGQGGPPGAGPPPVINPRAEDRSRQLAEGRLRSAEIDAANETEKEKHVAAAIQHMKEDFTRIQVVRNDIARNLVARKPLDYKLIAEQTGEIHRRSNRLNLYMMAQAPGSKEEADRKQEEMISALVRLCKLIDSFTENPALKNASTLDLKRLDKAKEDKARADKDLLEIIKLSETIRKRSQDLRMAP